MTYDVTRGAHDFSRDLSCFEVHRGEGKVVGEDFKSERRKPLKMKGAVWLIKVDLLVDGDSGNFRGQWTVRWRYKNGKVCRR